MRWLALLAALACNPTTDSTAHAKDELADIQVGVPAPDFTLKKLDGQSFTLSEHRGKVVVLEWFNPGCPFVQHAYGEGPLKGLAKRWTDKGVVWVTINSGSPGKQGTGTQTNTKARDQWSMTAPVLLDESGDVGRSYGARTTPQLVVIDPQGDIVYNGALDNAPLGKVKGDDHRLYIDEVLTGVLDDGKAPFDRQKPYGCSVKY